MAKVISATSFDMRFNPSNILTPDAKEFWITTGLYPQELIIDLGAPKNLNDLKIATSRAKKVQILGCENDTGADFKLLGDDEVASNHGAVSTTRINLVGGQKVKLLKIVIAEGHDDFAAVHQVTF